MLYRCANSLVDNAVCKSIVMLDPIFWWHLPEIECTGLLQTYHG